MVASRQKTCSTLSADLRSIHQPARQITPDPGFPHTGEVPDLQRLGIPARRPGGLDRCAGSVAYARRKKDSMSDTKTIADWLADGARSEKHTDGVLTEFCNRLRACGIPIS